MTWVFVTPFRKTVGMEYLPTYPLSIESGDIS